MPLYDYHCNLCGKSREVLLPIGSDEKPACCGEVMTRKYSMDKVIIRMGYPAWVDRIEDIHKAQEQRGERLRMVHPREVRAT